MGYFSIEVKPTITASTMVAHTTKDVLFDWTPFQVPKGACKLLSVSATFRGINGGNQAGKKFDLYFAKSINGASPPTIGVDNATISAVPLTTNHLLGQTHFEIADWGVNGWDYMGNAQTGGGGASSNIPNLVLQGEPDSGDNVGYDTIYISGGAGGAIDFGTNVDIGPSAGVTIAGSDGTLDVIDGTDPRLVFAVGDIIHATGDIIVGELAEVNQNDLVFKFSGEATTHPELGYTVPANIAAWRIQNGAGAAGDLAEDDELFNIHPIKLTLSFER